MLPNETGKALARATGEGGEGRGGSMLLYICSKEDDGLNGSVKYSGKRVSTLNARLAAH